MSVLVAGASGGLGTPRRRRLAAAGAALTLLGRDRERLELLGLDAAVVAGDLRQAETAERAVAAAVSSYGRLDGLVVASGVVAFGPVGRASRTRCCSTSSWSTPSPPYACCGPPCRT